jgi:hypothetical protein
LNKRELALVFDVAPPPRIELDGLLLGLPGLPVALLVLLGRRGAVGHLAQDPGLHCVGLSVGRVPSNGRVDVGEGPLIAFLLHGILGGAHVRVSGRAPRKGHEAEAPQDECEER